MGHAHAVAERVDTPLREVRLYGWLGERYGRVHWLAVKTPSQAVRLLAANYPGFLEDFVGVDGLQRWRVWIGRSRMTDVAEGAMEGTARIIIAPVIRGAGIKIGGLKINMQTILGIGLIALAFAVPGGIASPWGQALLGAGIGMTLGGVIQMLSPIPKADDTRDKRNTFDGPVQLTAAGNPVPVVIGIVYAGSIVGSGAVHLDQIETDTPEAIDEVEEEAVGDGTVTYTRGHGWSARAREIAGGNGLKSHAYARFLDIISAGPIRGFVTEDPLKSIFFDGVPIRAADGTMNFDDTFIAFRAGTQDQPEVRGFSAVENEIAVGVVVTHDTPIIRTVTNNDLTAVLVRLKWPTLMRISSKGKQKGTFVQYALDVSADGGSYVTVLVDDVDGKTSSPFERQYRITLKPGEGPWNIRVRRITEDAEDIQTANAFSWEARVEVIDVRLRYPRTALVALSLDSEQFSTPNPARAYHVYGYEAFWIPSNYDPDTRAYSGAWNGTLTQNWTNNPAWVFYGALRDRLWGLGRRVPVGVLGDLLPALYAAAQYSDQLVPDGAGGWEPRFTCNTQLMGQQEAWKLLDSLASVFRGMHFWSAGSVNASHDAPGPVVGRFTNANVIGGVFNYEGQSLGVEFSVVIVFYNDPTDFGRRRPVRVQDDELVLKYGYITKIVEAFACPSRGQAIRVGRAVIAAAKWEGRAVSFSVGAEGAYVMPGQIIEIADRKKAGTRLGGRLKRATSTSVELDAPVTLIAGQTYTLTMVERQDQPIVRVVTNAPGMTSTLTWDEPLEAVPRPMSIWVLGSDAVQTTKWRVIRAPESPAWQWNIHALRYAPEKYDYIDNGAAIPPEPVTSIYQAPARPAEIVGGEAMYLAGSTQIMQTSFSWRPSPGAVRYVGQLQADDDNPLEFDTALPSVTWDNVDPGDYRLVVYAVGQNGKRSAAATYSITLDGIADPPLPLDSLALDVPSEGSPVGTLYWDAPTQMAVRSAGAVEIRFAPVTIGTASWAAAIPLGEVPGSDSRFGVTLADGTYLARTRSFDGQLSTEVAGVQYGNPVEGGGGGGGTLTVTASPAQVNKSGRGSSMTSSPIYWDIQGGVAPITISTAIISGDTVTITSPTAQSTTLEADAMLVGEPISGVVRCTVTDSAAVPETAHVDVPYRFSRYSTIGGGPMP